MTAFQQAVNEITKLQAKVKELEQELERKDEMHLEDLRHLRGQLQVLMNKYCLN